MLGLSPLWVPSDRQRRRVQLLGRADRISDFVRKGEEHGYTEITLSKGEGRRPLTIKRLMNSVDNSSKWLLNGGCPADSGWMHEIWGSARS